MSTDTQKLPELYRRFYKPLRKWLERRCHFNGVDPDDVAQEVFVRLMKYPAAQAHAGRYDGYIFRIAANVAANYRQLACNTHPHGHLDTMILDGLGDHDGFNDVEGATRMDPGDALIDLATPEEIATSESVGRRVRAVVSRMPVRMQQCLLMFVEHDLSHKDIAARLGITRGMVNHDLVDAYEKLRRVLP